MKKRVNQTIRLPSVEGKARCPQAPLRFSPYAWAKLLCLRDLGPTEVGGFGISSREDLLLVEDVILVDQRCSSVSVKFDDVAIADFFDDQVDQGRTPEEFARVWIHTHPGSSAIPSCTDEETFARSFGQTDWAVMFILARRGQAYARFRFGAGPGGELVIPIEVDFSRPFAGSDSNAWESDYHRHVWVEPIWSDYDRHEVARQSLLDLQPIDVWPDSAFESDPTSFGWPLEECYARHF